MFKRERDLQKNLKEKGVKGMKRLVLIMAMVTVTAFLSNVAWAGYQLTTNTYDAFGRLISSVLKDTATGNTISTTSYNTTTGKIASISGANGSTTTYTYDGGILRYITSQGGGQPTSMTFFDSSGQAILTIEDTNTDTPGLDPVANDKWYNYFDKYTSNGNGSSDPTLFNGTASNSTTGTSVSLPTLNDDAADLVNNFFSSYYAGALASGTTGTQTRGTHSGAQFLANHYKVTSLKMDRDGDGFKETTVKYGEPNAKFSGSNDVSMAIQEVIVTNTSGKELLKAEDLLGSGKNTDPSIAHNDGFFDPTALINGVLEVDNQGNYSIVLQNGQSIALVELSDALKASLAGMVGQNVSLFGDTNGTDADGNGSIEGDELASVTMLYLWEIR